MGIRNAFDPVDPKSLGTPVYTTVQASLFNRLRKSHGKNAGNLAWLLVRLAQPDHREHDEACQMILARDTAALAALSASVGEARTAARTDAARDMFATIVESLDFARDSARNRERETKKASKL